MRSSEKLDNREVRNSAPLLTVTYRPSARSFIPTYWVEASIVSVIFTLLIGIPNLFNTDSPYTDTQAIVLLTVHLITLVPPMAHMLGVYKRHKDLFHPR